MSKIPSVATPIICSKFYSSRHTNKMRLIILPICFSFCLADSFSCNIVGQCNADISKRLLALENDMENVKLENSELKIEVENVKAENVGLKNQVEKVQLEMENVKAENSELKNEVENLKNQNEELSNDILVIENIVMPGKIPASCQEYQDRGEIETGSYKIKPTVDIEPFSVICDFRKWCPLFKSVVFHNGNKSFFIFRRFFANNFSRLFVLQRP